MKAMTISNPKRCTCDDTRSLIPTGLQDDIRLKNCLWKQWQITMDPVLKAEVNRLQRSVSHRFNECRNDQWSTTFESIDPEVHSL